jgi:hypothetical protein
MYKNMKAGKIGIWKEQKNGSTRKNLANTNKLIGKADEQKTKTIFLYMW